MDNNMKTRSPFAKVFGKLFEQEEKDKENPSDDVDAGSDDSSSDDTETDDNLSDDSEEAEDYA